MIKSSATDDADRMPEHLRRAMAERYARANPNRHFQLLGRTVEVAGSNGRGQDIFCLDDLVKFDRRDAFLPQRPNFLTGRLRLLMTMDDKRYQQTKYCVVELPGMPKPREFCVPVEQLYHVVTPPSTSGEGLNHEGSRAV